MKIFTKLFLVFTLIGSHLFSMTAMAVSGPQQRPGISPISKGGNTVWKLMDDNRATGLVVSAQNARPAFIPKMEDHACSKIYEAAVSSSFHLLNAPRSINSMYANVTLAAFTPAGNDTKPLPSISAYPNPARGHTKLALSQPFSNGNFKVKLSNTIGRVIGTYDLPSTEQKVIELDLEGLPAGVYFYSLLVDDKMVETKRLILQK
jgi:hypothetical protein